MVVVSNDMVHQTGDVMIVQITLKLKQDNLSIPITNNDVSVDLPVKLELVIDFHREQTNSLYEGRKIIKRKLNLA